jgi:hypothetical protein
VSDTDTSKYAPVRELTIDDRRYDLMPRQCSNCGVEHYEIWRWCGASFARYKMPPHFTVDGFEEFVYRLDDQLLESSYDLVEQFREALEEVNSPQGIEADFSFSFRLLEYGRQRASLLQKLGFLDAVTLKDAPTKPDAIAVRTAFELGVAAAEHRLMVHYEDYVHDGIAMSEWRDSGLPKARQERLRQGAKTRAAILEATKRLYEKNPALVRNDCETARQIVKLRLPALQKGNSQCLSLDAITRHLRDARRETQDPGKLIHSSEPRKILSDFPS